MAASGQDVKDYVEGEVIVTFKPSLGLPGAENLLKRHSLKFARHFDRLSERGRRHTGLVRETARTTAAIIADLKADASVESVEPNYLRWVGAAPNDASFAQLWALQNTGQAVDGVTGTSGADMKYLAAAALSRVPATLPVVGIMDTGIDRHHPDLQPNLWTNPGETALNGMDDDGNGYVDDIFGFDFTATINSIEDSGEHGTHVAGTIGAVGGNQIGVIGTNPLARLMTLKVSSIGSTITASAVLDALDYAIDMKTRGVNLVALNASFGGGSSSTAERSAIVSAGNAGIILCAAAGNETANNDTTPSYPASYRLSNMIVVAATDQNDALATFSNRGATTVDLAAPGVNIYSTEPGVVTQTFQSGGTTYQANILTYSGAGTVTGTLHLCGIGNTAEFPAAVNGNIALIQRGTLTFAQKVANATAAGARAVVIYNNAAGNFNGTLANDGPWIPGVALSLANGLTLTASLPATGTVTVSRSTLYQYLDGTSMATPQVTAAVSLAAAHFPEDTVAQRIQRVLANVDKKAGLTGMVITGGRLNLQRILDSDANTLPDWWEKLYFGVYTGTSLTGDLDRDGLLNGQEYLAGTNPKNPASALRVLSTRKSPVTGLMTLTWASVPGKRYQIYANPTLRAADWAPLPGQSAVTAGSAETQISVSDATTAGVSKRFYRVQLVTE